MIRILLADNQAIFRAGTVRVQARTAENIDLLAGKRCLLVGGRLGVSSSRTDRKSQKGKPRYDTRHAAFHVSPPDQ